MGACGSGRRRLITACVKLHREALPPVFQLVLRGAVGRDASRSNGGGSRPSGTSLGLLHMSGHGLLTAGFQAGWLLELGLRGLRQRLCRCRACRFLLLVASCATQRFHRFGVCQLHRFALSLHVLDRPKSWDERPRHPLPRGYSATIPCSRVAEVIRRDPFVSRAAGVHLITPCCPQLANTRQELSVGHFAYIRGKLLGTVAGCPCRLRHPLWFGVAWLPSLPVFPSVRVVCVCVRDIKKYIYREITIYRY